MLVAAKTAQKIDPKIEIPVRFMSEPPWCECGASVASTSGVYNASDAETPGAQNGGEV